jgi:hypothetical protein
MIQYGSTDIKELQFHGFRVSVEPRDSQWIDVELRPEPAAISGLPADISQLTALLICTYSGDIAQIVPQDEGRDCEYQFTESEKTQLRDYYEKHVRALLLQQAQAGQQR